MKILARRKILNLRPYEPGKPIKELQRELGLKEDEIIKLASNENPIGPSPKAIKTILDEVKNIHRYPDGSGFYLKRRLASMLRLKPENIVLGNGSDELIDIITKAFLEEDEEVIISIPSFLEYEIIVNARGARLRTVALKEAAIFKRGGLTKSFRYDIDKILASTTKKTKLVFLGNPDNPSGAYLNKDELRSFLKSCPERVIVVFDEAYRELVEDKDYSNPMDYLSRHNLIILRTLSKAYGLAGLRIGYAVTTKELAGWMERVRLPFNTNMLAQVAAEAALDDKAHLAKTRKAVREGKDFLVSSLKRLGFEVIESPANFMLVSYKGVKGRLLFKRLLPYGVIIRDMNSYGLHNWVRINVGTMRENKRLIDTIKKVI